MRRDGFPLSIADDNPATRAALQRKSSRGGDSIAGLIARVEYDNRHLAVARLCSVDGSTDAAQCRVECLVSHLFADFQMAVTIRPPGVHAPVLLCRASGGYEFLCRGVTQPFF